jgi:Protein of unknown function (DUF3142)
VKPKLGSQRSSQVAATVLLAALIAEAFRLGTAAPLAMRRDRMRRVPRVVLWVWERREDLSFIDPRQIAVAYLDRTLELSADTVVVRPRLEPLTVPAQTVLIPLARVEIHWRSPPSLSDAQRSEVLRIIEAMAAASPPAIQIDFDATRSQRAFYRDLLAQVRARLPASTALSITALASWCMYDDWVTRLPVNEIVPMLYRMGPDAEDIMSYLRGAAILHRRSLVSASGCRLTIGLRVWPAASAFTCSLPAAGRVSGCAKRSPRRPDDTPTDDDRRDRGRDPAVARNRPELVKRDPGPGAGHTV